MPESHDASTVLFQPLRINSLLISNRLAMGPIAAHSPTPDGRPSDATIAFFEERARGGIGLIIVGGAMSTAHGWNGSPSTKYYLRLDKEEFVADLRRLTAAVHAHGTPIFPQLNTSMGRMGKPGPYFIAASAVNVVMRKAASPPGIQLPKDMILPTPREATIAEIEALETDTARSALLMKSANFDGVELGAHMSYFLASFLSPHSNHRTDRYGGSLENRTRILVNIIRKIRAEAGSEFPIGVRISVNEHLSDGMDAHEAARIAQLLEREGVDYIAMTNGVYETMNLSVAREDGLIVKSGDAAVMRKAVAIPLLVQTVHDPEIAAAAIAHGDVDMVMLSRQMLADPQYPAKVRAGRSATIVRCNRDNHCLRRLIFDMPIRCPLNPTLGRETRRGALPPLKRWVPGVIERIVLGLTGSKPVMRAITGVVSLVGRASRRQPGHQ